MLLLCDDGSKLYNITINDRPFGAYRNIECPHTYIQTNIY